MSGGEGRMKSSLSAQELIKGNLRHLSENSEWHLAEDEKRAEIMSKDPGCRFVLRDERARRNKKKVKWLD
jgi:predicted Fe-S protein YdhL (DUF1289 family)